MKLKPISNVGNQRALLYRRYTDLEKSITKSTIYSTYDGKYWSFSGETNQFIQVSSTYPHTEIQSVSSSTKLKFANSYLSYIGNRWINDTPLYTYTTEEIEASLSSFEKTYNIEASLFRGAVKMKVRNNSDGVLFNARIYIYSDDDPTTAILSTAGIQYYSEDEEEFVIQNALQSNATTGKIVLTASGLSQAGTLTISFEYSQFNTLTAQFPMVQKYQLNKYYYVGSFNYMLKGGVDTEDVQYIKGAITPTRTINIRWFEDEMQIDHDDLVVLEDRLWVVNSVSWDIKRMPKQFKVYFGTLTSIL